MVSSAPIENGQIACQWIIGQQMIANQKLMRHLSCENMDQMFKQLHIDRVISIGPQYIRPLPKLGEDIFGCRYQNADYGTGTYSEYTYHRLALFRSVEEIEDNYTWLSPDCYDTLTSLIRSPVGRITLFAGADQNRF